MGRWKTKESHSVLCKWLVVQSHSAEKPWKDLDKAVIIIRLLCDYSVLCLLHLRIQIQEWKADTECICLNWKTVADFYDRKSVWVHLGGSVGWGSNSHDLGVMGSARIGLHGLWGVCLRFYLSWGTWVAWSVKHLPSAQVIIPGPWDQIPLWLSTQQEDWFSLCLCCSPCFSGY